MNNRTAYVALVLFLCECSDTIGKSTDAPLESAKSAIRDTDKTKPGGGPMVCNAEDPICGMATADGYEDTAHYDGKVYGFCSSGCKKKFLRQKKRR